MRIVYMFTYGAHVYLLCTHLFLDINECEDEGICFCEEPTRQHNCTSTCVNTDGFYNCLCQPTSKFVPSLNKQICIGE